MENRKIQTAKRQYDILIHMQKREKILQLASSFKIPLLVTAGILLYGLLNVLHFQIIAFPIVAITIILGSYKLLEDTVSSLLQRHFALDYIAIMAIALAVITGQYLVAA